MISLTKSFSSSTAARAAFNRICRDGVLMRDGSYANTTHSLVQIVGSELYLRANAFSTLAGIFEDLRIDGRAGRAGWIETLGEYETQ